MKGYGERPRVSLAVEPPAAGRRRRRRSQPAPARRRLRAPPADRRTERRGPPTEEELRALLERHRGNIAAVGRELGKERMQVHRWLKRYNIDLAQYR